MSDIFISYSKRDRDRILAIAENLEAAGWSVFWDPDIPAGVNWRDLIESELKKARCVIVAWSKTANRSIWVRDEATVAMKLGSYVPILIDQDIEPPMGFRSLQAIPFSVTGSAPSHDDLNQLKANVSRMFEPSSHGRSFRNVTRQSEAAARPSVGEASGEDAHTSTPRKRKSASRKGTTNKRRKRKTKPQVKPPEKTGRQLAVVPDQPDQRDLLYEPSFVRLPHAVSPPGDLSILDQGSEPASTAFALAAVINLMNLQNGKHFDASARMLHEMAQHYDVWPGESHDGISCRSAIRGWRDMGVCAESEWPYDVANPGRLTIARAKQARTMTLSSYYRVRPILEDFQSALTEVGAILISCSVHDGWSRVRTRDRYATIPLDPERSSILGAHAVAIVGFDDDGFWVQNSWGPHWGALGFAVWTYADWSENLLDAWVFRLGSLAAAKTWAVPSRPRRSLGDNPSGNDHKPLRIRILGHFAHLNGDAFYETDRYWTDRIDVENTSRFLAQSDLYNHLLFYADDGLKDVDTSARRIERMRDVFQSNRIYPYHLLYSHGLLEQMRADLARYLDELSYRLPGPGYWSERLVDRETRSAGRALWREVKRLVRTSFQPETAGAVVLETFTEQLAESDSPIRIHLLGHSTGAIVVAYLLDALARIAPAGLRVSTCSLLAPATTIDLFDSHIHRHLVAPADGFGVDRTTVYNLSDEIEQRDPIAPLYRRSWLELISHAYEEDPRPARLLGLQRFSGPLEHSAPRDKLGFVYSDGATSGPARSAAESHEGVGSDAATLNDVLQGILGEAPRRPFTEADLEAI